jgi:hypothetical protein
MRRSFGVLVMVLLTSAVPGIAQAATPEVEFFEVVEPASVDAELSAYCGEEITSQLTFHMRRITHADGSLHQSGSVVSAYADEDGNEFVDRIGWAEYQQDGIVTEQVLFYNWHAPGGDHFVVHVSYVLDQSTGLFLDWKEGGFTPNFSTWTVINNWFGPWYIVCEALS